MPQEQTIHLLFMCMGNICRSPTAEGVMQSYVERHGLAHQIICDSAGTIGHHTGDKADSRMMRHAQQRGYQLTSRSRQFDPAEDFEHFDFILTMDDDNYANIQVLDPAGTYRDKIHRMTDYCSRMRAREVPDPYYGGAQGFEEVLDILEDACAGLLEQIRHQYGV